MSKIFVILGKSCTGKDTLLESIIQDESLNVNKIIPYTTRPKRKYEVDGVDYHFVSKGKLDELDKLNKIIETRLYKTDEGDWIYGTPAVDLQLGKDYIIIGTLESFECIQDYYGANNVIPIYLECSDFVRLIRAISCEKNQDNPNYKEVCRRFLADEDDYTEEAVSYLIPDKCRYQTSNKIDEEYLIEAIKEHKQDNSL